jgi:hypothetical protein
LTESVRSFHVPDTPFTRLPAEHPFGADLARHPSHLRRERRELVDHVLIVAFRLEDLALTSTVIFFERSPPHLGHVGDVAHPGQVRRHRVDRIGQVFPGARDALHVGLAAELAFGPHFARDPRHFRANDRSWSTIVLMVFFSSEISPLTSTVIFFIAARRDGGRHLGDVAHLHVRLPAMKFTDSVKSFHVPATPCTSAWPPSLLGTDLARDPSLGGERSQLVDHR